MIRRLVPIGLAAVAIIPAPAIAEYPHYLNVMPAPPAAPARAVMTPQAGDASMAGGAGSAGAPMRMAQPPQAAPTPAAVVEPRAPGPGPATADNVAMAAANAARPPTAPLRVAMPAPNAPPAPAPPVAPTVKENSGAWVLQCWSAPAKRCEILQQRVDLKSQQQILLIGFSIKPDAAPQLTMVTPIGLKSRATLPLLAEQETLVEAPLKGCIASGCVHILDVSPDMVARLSGAKDAGALVQLPDERLAKIALDINGLATGLEKATKFIR